MSKQNTDTKQAKPKSAGRQKLANTGKLVVAVLLALLMLPAMSMVWVKDGRTDPQYCASCHGDPYYTTFSDPATHALAQQHAAAGISCQTCHQRTLGESGMEVVNYITGNYYYPFPETEMPMQTCFTCHVDYDTVASRTTAETSELHRNPHAGHWGELECGLCHNMHRDSVDYCAQCHGPTTEQDGWDTKGTN
jgi:hypothetical protein